MALHHDIGDGSSRQPPTKVFSIRLSEVERRLLGELAGNRPIGAYVRERIFAPHETHARLIVPRSPSVDEAALSKALASLGQSRLSSNLNQLAQAVHLGVLPVTTETEAEIAAACRAVLSMRHDLMSALGLRS